MPSASSAKPRAFSSAHAFCLRVLRRCPGPRSDSASRRVRPCVLHVLSTPASAFCTDSWTLGAPAPRHARQTRRSSAAAVARSLRSSRGYAGRVSSARALEAARAPTGRRINLRVTGTGTRRREQLTSDDPHGRPDMLGPPRSPRLAVGASVSMPYHCRGVAIWLSTLPRLISRLLNRRDRRHVMT